MNPDRLLSMKAASALLGIRTRYLRERLHDAHRERGGVLVKIKRYYYTTESALRELLPKAFTVSRSQADRIADLEGEVDRLEELLLEQKRKAYALTVRVRKLEGHTRPDSTSDDA